MAWEAIETAPKDGTRFLAAQDGEVYVAKYDTSTVPPALVFRQHRNHVRRQIVYELINNELWSKPINQPWQEQFEHIWRVETRGFKFHPTYWMPYEEPPQ
jgi:hypothetical protein